MPRLFYMQCPEEIRRHSMVILRTLVFVFGFVLLGERSFADERSPAQLIEALRGGGHTLYIRHAATDWSQSDTVVKFGDWKSCDPGKMRQLSDAGRIAAERIGIAMRALEIPIGKVLSSEYCRAIETAERLAIGTVVYRHQSGAAAGGSRRFPPHPV